MSKFNANYHISGKVYDLTQENFNAVLEAWEQSAENTFVKSASDDVLCRLHGHYRPSKGGCPDCEKKTSNLNNETPCKPCVGQHEVNVRKRQGDSSLLHHRCWKAIQELQQDGSPPERKPSALRPEEEGTEAGDMSRTADPLGDPNSKAKAAAEEYATDTEVMDTAEWACARRSFASGWYAALRSRNEVQTSVAGHGVPPETSDVHRGSDSPAASTATTDDSVLESIAKEADRAAKAIGFSARRGDQSVADTFRWIRDTARQSVRKPVKLNQAEPAQERHPMVDYGEKARPDRKLTAQVKLGADGSIDPLATFMSTREVDVESTTCADAAKALHEEWKRKKKDFGFDDVFAAGAAWKAQHDSEVTK